MFKLIKEFLEFRKMKHQRVVSCKRFCVMQTLIKYFTDLQNTTGYLDLPPFIKAQNMMQTIKTEKQLNRMYKTLELARLL